MNKPFALWITGRPASGKTTLVRALQPLLRSRGIDPAILDTDTFRKYFMPQPARSEEDRLRFYRGIVEVAAMFLEHEVPVVIDATGFRRSYRSVARERLPRFGEVLVECPEETCADRDPQGMRHIRTTSAEPGPRADYEPPLSPEVRVRSDREDPDEAARKVLDFLVNSGWIPSKKAYQV